MFSSQFDAAKVRNKLVFDAKTAALSYIRLQKVRHSVGGYRT